MTGAIREHLEQVHARLEDPASPDSAPLSPWAKTGPGGLRRLQTHLEGVYGIDVVTVTEFDPGVFRVDRRTGVPWVARVFPGARSMEAVEGDADVLRFLEAHAYPAERCATAEPVSRLGGRGVLVTQFVEGVTAPFDVPTLHAIGEMVGRLHTLPAGPGAVQRLAGAWHRLSVNGGCRRRDVDTLTTLLDDAKELADPENRRLVDALHEELAAVDFCDDLPRALVNVDLGATNVLVTPSGSTVAVDWAGAGWGARVLSLSAVMAGATNPRLIDAFAAGYRTHVRLDTEELGRLAAALRLHALVLECWVAVFAPDQLARIVAELPARRQLTEAVAKRAAEAFVAA